MDAFGIIALIAAVLAGIGLLIYLGWRYERKRTEALQQIAAELGFDFSPGGDLVHSPADRFAALRLFSQGRSRKVRNLMRGAGQNAEVSIFDYSYTVGSGKNKKTYRQTVICLESPALQIPDFELRPEHLFHRIGGLFGYQDIDFGDYPEFSRKYLLRGPNEAAIRSAFDAAIVAHLESLDRAYVEGHSGQLVFYRHAKRVRPEEVRGLLEEAYGVFALLRGAHTAGEPSTEIAGADADEAEASFTRS